mgnify:CR=1 FL=1
MVPVQRSFYTLMQYKPFQKAVKENNEKEFEKILWESGVDIDLPYEVISCQHRPDPAKPFVYNGPMVTGTERNDKEYLKSGIASWEAIVESCDAGLRAELKMMGREGAADRAFDKYEASSYSVE